MNEKRETRTFKGVATRRIERGALPHTPRFIALVSGEAVMSLMKKEAMLLHTASPINPHGRSGRSSALPYPPLW